MFSRFVGVPSNKVRVIVVLTEDVVQTTIQTLTRRAQPVCDSTDSLTDETNYLNNVFSKNYNMDIAFCPFRNRNVE